MTEFSRDELFAYAQSEGLQRPELTYIGPGRTEGNADRRLANALAYLVDIGCEDERSGDVESADGHFARIARWLVVTDSSGFVTVTDCDTTDAARELFAAADHEYGRWLDHAQAA